MPAAPTSWAKTKAISACAWRATTTPCASTTVRAGGYATKNHDMGLYFINDPDDYWIEVLPVK